MLLLNYYVLLIYLRNEFNKGLILAIVSAYSDSTSESKVIPPPPQKYKLESTDNTVRMAILKSLL